MKDQDSATIIITFLLLLPWLGRAAVSVIATWRGHMERQSRKTKETSEADWVDISRYASGNPTPTSNVHTGVIPRPPGP
jgi:hypothetical protein